MRIGRAARCSSHHVSTRKVDAVLTTQLALASISLAGLVFLLGCNVHDDISITYENRTTVDLYGDINGGGFEKIEAGETSTIGHRLSDDVDADRVKITIKTEEDIVIFSRVYDRKELQDMGNRVILEQSLLE